MFILVAFMSSFEILFQDIFLFSKTSRLTLGPTQPPIQCVLGLFPDGTAARAWCQPLSTEGKNELSYTHTPPICLHGMDTENFTSFMILI